MFMNFGLFCTQAIIHPDTEEKIFMPFRMSGMYHKAHEVMYHLV